MAGAGVLVTGVTGGREIALAAALRASSEVSQVEVVPDIAEGLRKFTGPVKPLVVIGPEALAVAGAADDLRARGYPVFAASRAAAQYEASKSFATTMMQQQGIPHPATVISRSAAEDQAYIEAHDPHEYVIKADGLAGGKGVVLPDAVEEARETVRAMRAGAYDGAGRNIINFSERHSGPEVSMMVVVGKNDEHVILPFSQDHKRLGEGDTGPNTCGIGAYAPLPESIVSPRQHQLLDDLAAKSLAGMRAYGTPFENGTLYIGAMLSQQQNGEPVVIEYNVRFGDPESQVLMPLLVAAGVDVYRLLYSAAIGKLEVPSVDLSNLPLSALSVCLCAPGYPTAAQKGAAVYGLDGDYLDVTVQPAGVQDGKVSGGRAVYVTGTGKTLQEARDHAYAAIDVDRVGPTSGKVGFTDMQFRRDIGGRALGPS